MTYFFMNKAHAHTTITSLLSEANNHVKSPHYQEKRIEEALDRIKHDYPRIQEVFFHYRTAYDASYYGPCEHEIIVLNHNHTTVSYHFLSLETTTMKKAIEDLQQAHKPYSKSLYRLMQMREFLSLEGKRLDVSKKWIMHTLGSIAESNKQKTDTIVLYLEVNVSNDLQYIAFANALGVMVTHITPFKVTTLGKDVPDIRYMFINKTLFVKPVIRD